MTRLTSPTSTEVDGATDLPAPRISVVIPCYQDGLLLDEALRSLRAEEPCEVVVVDDGSTDPVTIDVLAALERSGCTVLHQERHGPSAARNTGLRATNARYVFPLDADDMVSPGGLTALADLLDQRADVSLAWGSASLFGPDIPEVRVDLRITELDPWRITYLNEIPGGSLIRRTALESVGGWRDGTGYEDWDLWMTLAEKGYRGAGVPVLVQRYRIHAPRRWTEVSAQHAAAFEELRSSHRLLFSQRTRHWRASRAPWRVRLCLPAVEALPLSRRRRWQLAHLLLHPTELVTMGRIRRGWS